MVTPFSYGKVDYDAYAQLVRRQAEAGIHFLVITATTSESPCLASDEKLRILEVTRENAPGGHIMAGVGTNSYIHTVENMRLLDAADSFLIVAPYYNNPTQKGMISYFQALAQETDKPVMLYNVPSRTGANLTPDTVLRLADTPNIVGIKEASGNLQQMRDILANAPEDFSVISGNDDLTLQMMLEGGKGVISVASNVVPRMMTTMVESASTNDYTTACRIFKTLLPLFHACFVESNPIPVKEALAQMSLIHNELRLPLVTASETTAQIIAKAISRIKDDIV